MFFFIYDKGFFPKNMIFRLIPCLVICSGQTSKYQTVSEKTFLQANTSECLENLEEMLPLCCMHIQYLCNTTMVLLVPISKEITYLFYLHKQLAIIKMYLCKQLFSEEKIFFLRSEAYALRSIFLKIIYSKV